MESVPRIVTAHGVTEYVFPNRVLFLSLVKLGDRYQS